MKIIDLNGFAIVLDDLEKAIDFADYFKDAHHVPMVGADKIRQDMSSIIGPKKEHHWTIPMAHEATIKWESYLQLDQNSMLELLTNYEFAASAVPNVWKKKKRKKRR